MVLLYRVSLDDKDIAYRYGNIEICTDGSCIVIDPFSGFTQAYDDFVTGITSLIRQFRGVAPDSSLPNHTLIFLGMN